jgi:hypothetical protein
MKRAGLRSDLMRLLVIFFAALAVAQADSNFDLTGPPLDIRVTRKGETLPIAKVPNLEAGDRLWLHPDFPQQQNARYLMVAVFLRGSTNPPPDNWFTHAETWVREVREEGVTVTVPADAQQALVFLAPETGGDFSTLRTNVRSKPGAFVRASQDLNQASLDRSRLNVYLAAVTELSDTHPEALKDASKLLARSLNLKVDNACFQKPAAQQLACLTENPDAMVLDDGHTQSMVAELTSGSAADLIGQLSATPMAGAGAYSPYVGAIVDVVRITDSIHTAQYQYIPALVEPKQDQLMLKLNNPPSFINPKSVLTVGLPAIIPPQLPPLRAVNPDQVYCAETPSLVLPADGAPLVYSTSLGYDFALHIQPKKGPAIDLPAQPEAIRGGFVIDTHAVEVASMDPESTGILRGRWGFQPFDGPSFHLESSHSVNWNVPDADKSALIVGRQDTLHLEGDSAACVDKVSIKPKDGKAIEATYKVDKPGEIAVTVPFKDATPGPVTLLVAQTGLSAPDQVKLQAYAEGAHLDQFTFYAGDASGTLKGARLDEVLKLEMNKVSFTPAGLKRIGDEDDLTMTSTMAAAELKAGDKAVAQVLLNDGRKLDLPVTVQPARPKVTLLSKSVDSGQAAPSPIRLTNQDELPQDGILNFVLQSADAWPQGQKIEVATTDGAFHTTLGVENGSLTLQDAKTVLATLNPLKSFGPSAFGPLRFRPVDENGVAGDWQPLGNLVRIPTLKEVRCPENAEKQCSLSGSNLFLLDSVASSQDFKISTPVPVGFASSVLSVPRPSGTLLYIKLRDDPGAVNVVALPVMPE